jgi:hypothetical protein
VFTGVNARFRVGLVQVDQLHGYRRREPGPTGQLELVPRRAWRRVRVHTVADLGEADTGCSLLHRRPWADACGLEAAKEQFTG